MTVSSLVHLSMHVFRDGGDSFKGTNTKFVGQLWIDLNKVSDCAVCMYASWSEVLCD